MRQLTQQYNVNVSSGMYVIRLTCVAIPTMIPANTLTLCYSIWAAYPNTVTLYGYQMLMQVNTLNTLLGDRLPIW